MCVYIYVYIYIYPSVFICPHILSFYICIESTHTHIYIYIYIHKYKSMLQDYGAPEALGKGFQGLLQATATAW